MPKPLHLFNLVAFAVSISCIALQLGPETPYLYIFPLISVVSLNAMFVVPRRRFRVLVWYICFLGILFTAGEYAALRGIANDRKKEKAYDRSNLVRTTSLNGNPASMMDDTLGVVLRPNSILAVDYPVGDTTNHIHYTINEHGLRITPSLPSGAPAVAIFGCSQSFGEGVDNQQAFPFLLGSRYSVFNFAYSGEGPHHMYARIRYGAVSKVMQGQAPVMAIYWALPDHINRALGRYQFTKYHPWFKLHRNHELRYHGRFDQPRLNVLERQLYKSHLYVYSRYRMLRAHRQLRKRDLRLFVELVKQARELFCQEWPSADFVVVFDDSSEMSDIHTKRQVAALEAAGVDLVLASELVPELVTGRSLYVNSDQDGHYNACGHRLIASALEQYIESNRNR